VGVQVNSSVLRGNPADGLYGTGFGEDQRGAADGAAAEVHHVPRLRVAVFGGIFAHGRDADAIFEFDIAQLERREQRHVADPFY
jgi:hypothetical protein